MVRNNIENAHTLTFAYLCMLLLSNWGVGGCGYVRDGGEMGRTVDISSCLE